MIRWLFGASALALLAMAGLAYTTAEQAKQDRAELAALRAEQNRLLNDMAALEAELAYLEAPQRLAALSAAHLDLAPTDPLQVVSLDEAPDVLGGEAFWSRGYRNLPIAAVALTDLAGTERVDVPDDAEDEREDPLAASDEDGEPSEDGG